MKNVKRMLSLLILAALMGTLMTTVVLADENPGVWLSVTEDTQQGTVTVLIVTNTTVTSGNVKLRFDSSALTYKDLTVSSDYVLQHSVNSKDPGAVKIAWVAPGAYTAGGSGLELMRITFTGADASSLELSGVIHDSIGAPIHLTVVDTDALEAAIGCAEALDAAAYSAESWANVASALAQAKAALEDPTVTQTEADAAAAALNAAIAALEAAPSVPPTEPGESGGDNSQTGDQTPLVPIIIVMAVCLVGIIVVVIVMIRKGRKK